MDHAVLEKWSSWALACADGLDPVLSGALANAMDMDDEADGELDMMLSRWSAPDPV